MKKNYDRRNTRTSVFTGKLLLGMFLVAIIAISATVILSPRLTDALIEHYEKSPP